MWEIDGEIENNLIFELIVMILCFAGISSLSSEKHDYDFWQSEIYVPYSYIYSYMICDRFGKIYIILNCSYYYQ